MWGRWFTHSLSRVGSRGQDTLFVDALFGLYLYSHLLQVKRHASTAITRASLLTRDRISQLIDWEYSYINTKHEDFDTFETAYDEANRRVKRRKNPGQTVKKQGWLQVRRDRAMSAIFLCFDSFHPTCMT